MAHYLVALCLLVASVTATPRQVRIDTNGNWRVVGGNAAAPGAHPHQVSLQSSGSHNCGGSIVDNEWVITAAHCVAGSSPSRLTVVTGSNKLNEPGDRYQVREVHYHENYDAWNILNDAAILKVDPIVYNDKVGPIVAETEDVGGNEPCTLSGWGTTSYPGSIPNDLQEVDLLTTTVDDCKSAHSGSIVIDSEICTLTKKGEGACHGDSGGPLTRTVNGIRRLIGIVSWGRPCAQGYPDVFTRVSSFNGWFNGKCGNCLKK